MTPTASPPTSRPDRAKMISVRLTSEEYDALSAAATELGVGPSTLARTLIRQGLGAETTPRSRPTTTSGSALEAELAAGLLARVEALERWVAEH